MGLVIHFSIKTVTATKLEKRLSKNINTTFLILGSSNQNELQVALFAILYPSLKKCSLYFINPLTSFNQEDLSLETKDTNVSKILIPHLAEITGHKVNYTIKISESNFARIVDILGGFPVFFDNGSVESSEKYKRGTGDILFSGEETLDYAKLAKKDDPLSYIARLNKQEALLLSFYDRIIENKNSIRKEWIYGIAGLVDTELTGPELFSLFNFITTSKISISISEMPGELYTHKASGLPQLYVKEEIANIAFGKFEDYLKSEDFADGEHARTEILNATGINGLAKSAKALLNEKRIKVLSTDNAQISNLKNSLVIDRSGNPEFSYKIASVLEIKKVKHIINKEIGLDTTVILGEDFGSNPAKN